MDYDYDELMCISAELLAEQAAAGELSDDTLRRIGHLSRFCKCLASAAPNGGKQWSLASAFAARKAWTRGKQIKLADFPARAQRLRLMPRSRYTPLRKGGGAKRHRLPILPIKKAGRQAPITLRRRLTEHCKLFTPWLGGTAMPEAKGMARRFVTEL
jgi:hypothetical protein